MATHQADSLQPPELPGVFPASAEKIEFDISRKARQARIDALDGAIPAWAVGDPNNDPALIRAGLSPLYDKNGHERVSAAARAYADECMAGYPAAPDATEQKPAGFLGLIRDPERWKQSVYDVTVWFLLGSAITSGITAYAPGYPMIVGTDSIPTGLYWVQKQPVTFRVGELASFPFEPQQPWLRAAYGDNNRVHTKIVLGLPGDNVQADANGNLSVCPPVFLTHPGIPELCRPAGQAKEKDGKGQRLGGWLNPGYQYTLQPGELWMYSPHPRSLDSRYHGPVPLASVYGKATPLLLFEL